MWNMNSSLYRSLCRVAWPKASDEQKDVALKARFEEGLRDSDMLQYLKLHASGDDFAATVQKAHIFASTTEPPSRPRKSVRISTPPPSHDSIQMLQSDSSLHTKMDKIENMIRSLQTLQNKIEKPQANGVKQAKFLEMTNIEPSSRTDHPTSPKVWE